MQPDFFFHIYTLPSVSMSGVNDQVSKHEQISFWTLLWSIHPSSVQIKVWHKCFKNGRESVESDPHSGRPAASRTPAYWESWTCMGCNQQRSGNCVRSQGAYFGGDWVIIVLCTKVLVSSIFFSKCLYFSYHVAGYFLDRPRLSCTGHLLPPKEKTFPWHFIIVF